MLYRPPVPADLPALNEMILRSKAIWGYDADFMKACEDELRVTPAHLAAHACLAAFDGEMPVGMAGMAVAGDTLELAWMFVDPEHMRRGIGRALMDWVVARSRLSGVETLIIHADPGAEDFYLNLGAVREGEAPSGSIAGRSLPRLTLDLRV